MMRRHSAAALAIPLLAWLALSPAPSAAQGNDLQNDLREFHVGMGVNEMPRAGYLGFSCADEPGRKLEAWQQFRQCPAEASGWRAVRFNYDEAANPLSKVNGLYEGTKVGGHPVLLTMMIGDDDRMKGMVIETDPAARLYLRKKAFLFGEQVKSRFGDAGWNCDTQEPSADQAPVGGVFINEHCVKTTATRRLTLDRAMYRRAGQDLKDFVSRSRLEIVGRSEQEAARLPG